MRPSLQLRVSVVFESYLRRHPRLTKFIPKNALERILPIPKLPFNGDYARINLVRDLADEKFCLAVETGTHYGVTAAHLSQLMTCALLSVENDDFFFSIASRRFPELSNSKELRLGNSIEVLNGLAPTSRTFFYLDAHWGTSPRLSELRIILESWSDFCIMIDDIAMPDLSLNGAEYSRVPFTAELVMAFLEDLPSCPVLKVFRPSHYAIEAFRLVRGWLILTDREDLIRMLAGSKLVSMAG